MEDEIRRYRLFKTADANKALAEYAAAFGDCKVFYLRQATSGTREDEAAYALAIRRAIRQGAPMTDAEVMEMYGMEDDPDAEY